MISSPAPAKKVKRPQALTAKASAPGLLPSAKERGAASNLGLGIWTSHTPTPQQAQAEAKSEITSNNYGGLEDEDDSQEAAAQPALQLKMTDRQTV